MNTNPIFNLKTSADELEGSNLGVSRMEYDQHPPTRDVTGNNFANGAIHFRFETSGRKWWCPSKSYIRTRFKLTKADGTAIVLSDGIAPNMSLMSSLFQSAEFRIADKVVSRCSDFMAQVDALETRLCKSKSWIDSIGNSSNWWQADQSERLKETATDGLLVPEDVPTTITDVQAGYPANTAVGYVATTGVITFGAGDANDLLAVGDVIAFTSGTGVTGTAGVPGVEMEILAITSALTVVVRAVVAVDIASNADIRFTIKTPPAEVESRRAAAFELTWQPPLSLFKIDHALPSGRYELVLNPQTASSFQKRAIESVLGEDSKNPALGSSAVGDYKIEIDNMYMYCHSVEGPRADDITYLLDLQATRCQSEKINSAAFQQKQFDVSPSTKALTVAFQDLRAGENTALSVSKFKSYDEDAVPTLSQELKLSRFFVNYSGQNLPSPDADPEFVAGKDYTTQRYIESQLYSGAYHDTGGAEKIEEFHDRGAYYYQVFSRDGTDRSTRVSVHQQFSGASDDDVKNMRVLLFDHSSQVARIRVQEGRVTDVALEDA